MDMNEKTDPENALTFSEIEKQITPDVVAARCDTYEFRGKKLKPFTKMRQTAAVTIGTRCFIGIGERDENGAYPELFLDAIKIVWLCTIDDGAVKRACRQPTTSIDLALSWWESEGGDIGSPVYAELIGVFTDILTDLQTVSAEVDSTGKGDTSESLGE